MTTHIQRLKVTKRASDGGHRGSIDRCCQFYILCFFLCSKLRIDADLSVQVFNILESCLKIKF